MFSEASDRPLRRLLVVLFVLTQQMFFASVVHAVFCAQGIAKLFSFFVILVAYW